MKQDFAMQWHHCHCQLFDPQKTTQQDGIPQRYFIWSPQSDPHKISKVAWIISFIHSPLGSHDIHAYGQDVDYHLQKFTQD